MRIFKAIFKSKWAHIVRDVFNKWRTQTNLCETAEFNQEYGPLRLEVNEYKRISKNIKALLEEDGYTKKEIQDIIEKDNENYKQQAEKVLCRLYCYGEA